MKGRAVSFGRVGAELRVEMRPQLLQRRHVDLLDIGEMGDAARRLRHFLGDAAAKPGDLDLFGPVQARGCRPWRGAPVAPVRNASRSSCEMRPAGPLPETWCEIDAKLQRAAAHRRRRERPLAGLAGGLLSGRPRAAARGAATRRRGFAGVAGPPDFFSRISGGRRRRFRLRLACRRRRLPGFGFAASSTSMPTSRDPTARTAPTSAPRSAIVPATGEGISTVALSVMTAARSWSSATSSPTATCHSTISASATPSPMSGSLTTLMRHLSPP